MDADALQAWREGCRLNEMFIQQAVLHAMVYEFPRWETEMMEEAL